MLLLIQNLIRILKPNHTILRTIEFDAKKFEVFYQQCIYIFQFCVSAYYKSKYRLCFLLKYEYFENFRLDLLSTIQVLKNLKLK